MARVLIATIVGGLIVFFWGFVSHEFLPIGTMGMHIDKLPGEAAIRTALAEGLPESGLYYVPGMDTSLTDKAASQTEWTERAKTGPVAFMVVRKEGNDGDMMKQLLSEAGTGTLAALVASLILVGMRGPYVCRASVVGALGLFTWLSYVTSETIWYGFPNNFAVAQLLDQVIGWSIAGLFMAAIVKPRGKGRAAAA